MYELVILGMLEVDRRQPTITVSSRAHTHKPTHTAALNPLFSRPVRFDSDSPFSLFQVAGGFISQLCGLLHAVLPSGTEETQDQVSLSLFLVVFRFQSLFLYT